MIEFADAEVAAVFAAYPDPMRSKLLRLRHLVFETARDTEHVERLEETLKWGEPSYVSKSGSTIRLGWKASDPRKYSLLFHCRTRLISTFRELYRTELTFDGNRAIVFDGDDRIPETELRHCIAIALTYDRRKKLPLLGV